MFFLHIFSHEAGHERITHGHAAPGGTLELEYVPCSPPLLRNTCHSVPQSRGIPELARGALASYEPALKKEQELQVSTTPSST